LMAGSPIVTPSQALAFAQPSLQSGPPEQKGAMLR
jgi:hypothetical protein